MSETTLKILVIRFSSIGDIVLTTPVIRGLKQQLGAEVHFLTKQQYASIVKSNPHVDRVLTMGKHMADLLKQLRSENYDHIIDLHHNLRTLRIKRSLNVPAKSFNKLNIEKWLLTNFKVNRLPEKHIVDRYLETVAPLGVQNDGQGLDFFFADPDRPLINTKKPYIAFAIGAAHATKRLPEEKILEICQALNYPIHLLGGPEENSIGDAISNDCVHVVNHCGKCSLEDSAKITSGAALVITHDTGMMHIAAALRRPILSIWGNTVPDFGMWAYYPKGMPSAYRFEVADLACRPCSKIGYDKCPKGHFRCMKQQDTKLIVETARKIIKEQS